jgi:hypothetical protein
VFVSQLRARSGRQGPEYTVAAATKCNDSGKRDPRVEIHILDGMQQGHALVHRALERLASRDEAHPARTLVDHGRANGFGQIGLTRRRRS